ncbi:hypothetical protein BDV23DRAFT_163407 [Aspergillus alliaceus]|uniref:Uncharacterized protein n=1 Tax=Petromyces alliaceus TaxID=209559 RepID=A0A5N7BWX5_PETAA|nr:hypothetical protein BDV23DRAFT_163407 [Aspergillus alliaceus]
MEDDSLVHRPSISHVDVPGSSLRGLSGHVKSNSYLYICCKCHDGPKLYTYQPKCVMCSHTVCSDCQYVK